MTIRSARAGCLAAALGLAAATPLGGCSVAANLSADELLREVDAIVRVEGAAPEYRIAYVDRAVTSSWLRRALYFGFWLFVDAALELFDGDDDVHDDGSELIRAAGEINHSLPKLEMPVEHVRELLRELPDEVGDDIRFAGLAASRYGWIAHYDAYPLSRIVAMDGLIAIADAFRLPVFRGDLGSHGFGPEAAELAAACAQVRALRPQRGRPATERDRAAYGASLKAAVAAPRQAAADRIQLVETLSEAVIAEIDDHLRAAAGDALRVACQHLLERLLIDLVQGRGRDDVDVRLCAMEHVRRAAGPDAVPFLLAVMAAEPAMLARGEPQYDTDPLVRLRLVHYCGQLRGEMLDRVLALPGRPGVVASAPADFLAVTALSETAYTSRLRTPAITALSWALQRPKVELDPAWVREWRQGRR